MSLFKKLFGGGSETQAERETYKGYHITPTPISEGGSFRVSALIERQTEGETRSHTLVRADTVQGLGEAQEASIRKAKQVIEEQGDKIFD